MLKTHRKIRHDFNLFLLVPLSKSCEEPGVKGHLRLGVIIMKIIMTTAAIIMTADS